MKACFVRLFTTDHTANMTHGQQVAFGVIGGTITLVVILMLMNAGGLLI